MKFLLKADYFFFFASNHLLSKFIFLQLVSPMRYNKTSLMETSTSSMTETSTATPPGGVNPLLSNKRKMRISLSCDNHLGESSRFGFSRRDSVGSGSPHSSKGTSCNFCSV